MFDPAIHHRRSIRLKHFDYTRPGAYYVTICTFERSMLFGEIADEQMRMNDVGRMVYAAWHEIPKHYGGVDVDAFIVMPNHVHGILWLGGAAPRGRPDSQTGQARGPAPTISLSDAVHRFKSLTTARFRCGAFEGPARRHRSGLWHRNYYEHIIRDENELNRIREYILTNPSRWAFDRENPTRASDEEKFDW